MRADLHTHSYYSDGLLSPADIARLCRQNGVQAAALTDHDSMNGCAAFADACRREGIKCVRGLEISAYTDVKVHILGYGLDDGCEAYKKFTVFVCDGALNRTEDILAKLKRRGVNLTFADVLRERRCESSPVHTMYIARAAARKGYSGSPGAFYAEMLAPGRCAYSAVGRPSPEYALEVISRCGGISSLAHPGRVTLSKDGLRALVKHLKDCGLNGIEAVYSGHTVEETAYFKEVAAQFSLLVTGGSDTHYSEGNRHIGMPEFYPSEELLAALDIR